MTGLPLVDYHVDPNVPGTDADTDALNDLGDDERSEVSSKRGVGVQIHIDTKDPDWLDKVGDAYLAAALAMGFDPREFKGPPRMIKGDPSLIKGLKGNE